MGEFDVDCAHKPGVRMSHVDALSRSPVGNERNEDESVLQIALDTEDWLLTMQLQDTKIREIVDVLRGTRKSQQEKQLRNEYKIENRLYRRDGDKLLFVIPKAVRWRIVRYCHDEMGHYGIEKTIQRITQHFWFPRIRKYVKDYISACVECCYNKNGGGKPEGTMYIDSIAPIPFQTLHIDHLGPFVKSKRGHTYVIAISDAFTKYLIVKPARNTKTQPVLQVLNELSSYFGLPTRIVSDRGTAYTSKQFEQFCDDNDVQHIKTAVRTPRANGQVERANKMILDFLRTSGAQAKEWDEQLRKLQCGVNSQTDSGTGFSPNDLVFDFKIRDVVRNKFLAAIIPDSDETSIADKRATALEKLQQQREKWKKRFDSKHKTPTEYKVDDLVVISNDLQSTGDSRKLDARYRGPYVVSKVLGKDRYLIEDVNGMQRKQKKFCSVYSADKMKLWCALPPTIDEDDSEDTDGDDIETMSM